MNIPSSTLRVRVSGNDDIDTYTQVGASSTRKLLSEAQLFATGPIVNVLDFGCGPGRVAVHIADKHPNIVLSGCDPDHEAIAWCQENIAGEFSVSSLYPPLSYVDESFDVIIALSVMTHLRRRVQRLWLKELHRVLRPGGLLLASVHGAAAAEQFGVAHVSGIEDHYLDPFMAEVLPADYYRTVLQTESYTRKAWSDWFEVISYEEKALQNHDLAVCKVSK